MKREKGLQLYNSLYAISANAVAVVVKHYSPEKKKLNHNVVFGDWHMTQIKCGHKLCNLAQFYKVIERKDSWPLVFSSVFFLSLSFIERN